MTGTAAEITLLRRFPGYLRLHVPPLIYSGKAAYVLEREISGVDGVRKVSIKKELGKLSVHFDNVLTPERTLLLLIDRIATPLLQEGKTPVYKEALAGAVVAQRKRLVRKTVVAVILVYLVDIHWRLLKRWLRDPITHWPKLLSIGALVYIHRKHIEGAVEFE